jgi:hypothetical protein
MGGGQHPPKWWGIHNEVPIGVSFNNFIKKIITKNIRLILPLMQVIAFG